MLSCSSSMPRPPPHRRCFRRDSTSTPRPHICAVHWHYHGIMDSCAWMEPRKVSTLMLKTWSTINSYLVSQGLTRSGFENLQSEASPCPWCLWAACSASSPDENAQFHTIPTLPVLQAEKNMGVSGGAVPVLAQWFRVGQHLLWFPARVTSACT